MNYFFKSLLLSFVFVSCAQNESQLNQAASIDSAHFLENNPLEQIAISSSIQANKNTMSTLYGNKIAADYARSLKGSNYPDKAVIYQVTWEQKADAVWYGAKIPGNLKSVEVINFHKDRDTLSRLDYKYYAGSPLSLESDPSDKDTRIKYILEQRIAMTP